MPVLLVRRARRPGPGARRVSVLLTTLGSSAVHRPVARLSPHTTPPRTTVIPNSGGRRQAPRPPPPPPPPPTPAVPGRSTHIGRGAENRPGAAPDGRVAHSRRRTRDARAGGAGAVRWR